MSPGVARAIAKLNFQQHPKSLTIKNQEKPDIGAAM